MPFAPEPSRPVSLTGIKPTGVPHLGNFVGAIRPAIALAQQYDAYYFIADSHALTTVRDHELLDDHSRSVSASWLACGLDPDATTFYRQSDCPQTFELAWVLACVTPKGLMNRAHAYKAARDKNLQAGLKDLDTGVNIGLYNYPVLMAADILIMQTDVVPVGKDQVQHVEYTRDIAERFNAIYGDRYALKLPRNVTSEQEDENALPGLDGRKMSKSYGNTIPLFCDRDELRRLVRRLRSDSTPIEAPKDPDSSTLFAIYAQFAGEDEQSEIRKRLLEGGFGWGEMKDALFERLDAILTEPRKRYNALLEDRKALDEILQHGAEKARARARATLHATRAAIGIR
jgi:tryptophanyl-tRNA synthetase